MMLFSLDIVSMMLFLFGYCFHDAFFPWILFPGCFFPWILFPRCPQARSRGGGGGVGGVTTPPSGINDIHNTNYIIQERPFDCF